MAVSADHLIWIDLEMTGLDTDRDCIIEIATLVTDKDLRVLASENLPRLFRVFRCDLTRVYPPPIVHKASSQGRAIRKDETQSG